MREDEQVAVVDEAGQVTASVPRAVMRRDNLRHRSTGVLLREPGGRIYVTRRAPDKDWCPSHHDAAAGGVVAAGEDPADTAVRELAEELGVTGVPLRPLLVERYEDGSVRSFVHVYEATYDGQVHHADGEVVWGAWMTLPELGRLLADPRWPFVPDTRAVLTRLSREGVGDYRDLDGAGAPVGPAQGGG